MTCEEYLKTEKNFRFGDFLYYAQGELSVRKFIKRCNIKSPEVIYALRDPLKFTVPSLKTVIRIADYVKVNAEELWIAVCKQVYREKDDFVIRRN